MTKEMVRSKNREPEKGAISVTITAGNKSSIGGVVIGGNLYQNCTIIFLRDEGKDKEFIIDELNKILNRAPRELPQKSKEKSHIKGRRTPEHLASRESLKI